MAGPRNTGGSPSIATARHADRQDAVGEPPPHRERQRVQQGEHVRRRAGRPKSRRHQLQAERGQPEREQYVERWRPATRPSQAPDLLVHAQTVSPADVGYITPQANSLVLLRADKASFERAVQQAFRLGRARTMEPLDHRSHLDVSAPSSQSSSHYSYRPFRRLLASPRREPRCITPLSSAVTSSNVRQMSDRPRREPGCPSPSLESRPRGRAAQLHPNGG